MRHVAIVRDWLFFKREYLPDRHVLEEVIFPLLLERHDVRRVLFVGCAWYTRRYPRLLGARELWTMDVDPRQARYGAERHIVDSLAHLSAHAASETFDAIVCSGVIGYGLDDTEEAEAAVRECFDALRPGGMLILGFDECAPFLPEQLDAIGRFEPTAPSPFSSPRYPTFSATGHTFDFYERPEAAQSRGPESHATAHERHREHDPDDDADSDEEQRDLADRAGEDECRDGEHLSASLCGPGASVEIPRTRTAE